MSPGENFEIFEVLLPNQFGGIATYMSRHSQTRIGHVKQSHTSTQDLSGLSEREVSKLTIPQQVIDVKALEERRVS